MKVNKAFSSSKKPKGQSYDSPTEVKDPRIRGKAIEVKELWTEEINSRDSLVISAETNIIIGDNHLFLGSSDMTAYRGVKFWNTSDSDYTHSILPGSLNTLHFNVGGSSVLTLSYNGAVRAAFGFRTGAGTMDFDDGDNAFTFNYPAQIDGVGTKFCDITNSRYYEASTWDLGAWGIYPAFEAFSDGTLGNYCAFICDAFVIVSKATDADPQLFFSTSDASDTAEITFDVANNKFQSNKDFRATDLMCRYLKLGADTSEITAFSASGGDVLLSADLQMNSKKLFVGSGTSKYIDCGSGYDTFFNLNGTQVLTIGGGGAGKAKGVYLDGDISLEDGSGTFKSSDGSTGWTGSFSNGDGDTVTVKDGIITDVS